MERAPFPPSAPVVGSILVANERGYPQRPAVFAYVAARTVALADIEGK
jgi:hypothetical protein